MNALEAIRLSADIDAADMDTQWLTEVLYHGPGDVVLRGPYRGQPVADAVEAALTTICVRFARATLRPRTLRPWWRLWRPTSALIITPCPESWRGHHALGGEP